MRIFKIPLDKIYPNGKYPKAMIGETVIDEWCKERELVQNKDYKCYYMSGLNEYHVTFSEENVSMGSLLLLRWM